MKRIVQEDTVIYPLQFSPDLEFRVTMYEIDTAKGPWYTVEVLSSQGRLLKRKAKIKTRQSANEQYRKFVNKIRNNGSV